VQSVRVGITTLIALAAAGTVMFPGEPVIVKPVTAHVGAGATHLTVTWPLPAVAETLLGVPTAHASPELDDCCWDDVGTALDCATGGIEVPVDDELDWVVVGELSPVLADSGPRCCSICCSGFGPLPYAM
jgi:hypothetical protein